MCELLFLSQCVKVDIGRDDHEGYTLGTKLQPAQPILRASPFPQTTFYFFLLLSCSIMTHENSPLLPQSKNTHCVEYGLPTKTETSSYDRFTHAQKRSILALVSLSGMLPCTPIIPGARINWSWLTDPFLREPWIVFVLGSFVPCIPQISRDLRTTATVVK